MGHTDLVFTGQVGNGAGYFEDSVKGPGGQAQLLGSRL